MKVQGPLAIRLAEIAETGEEPVELLEVVVNKHILSAVRCFNPSCGYLSVNSLVYDLEPTNEKSKTVLCNQCAKPLILSQKAKMQDPKKYDQIPYKPANIEFVE